MKYSDLSEADQATVKQKLINAALDGASCNELDEMLNELLKSYSASEVN